MTALPEAGADDVLYLVDMYCWVYRFYATVGGRAAHGVLDFIARVLHEQRPAYLAVCRDLPHRTWRADLYPKRASGEGYKAHRKAPDATLLERLRWTHEMLEDVHGARVIGVPGWEADDVIATWARIGAERGMRVVVLGFDKDLMQLVSPRCVLWDGRERLVGEREVLQRFGVSARQLRDYLAIVGDSADNVPGVPGMGPKAAARVLQRYPTIDDALALPETRDRDVLRLRAHEDALRLSRCLVTLDAAVPLRQTLEELRR